MNNEQQRPQTGFTLLEVLVAIVIISIGLLGLISLQSESLKNTIVAAAQSQATIAAQSMAARMRANMAGVEEGAYKDLSTDSVEDAPSCLNTNCSPQQIAKHGVYVWGRQLQQSLPNPTGKIKSLEPDGAPYEFRITIFWNAHHANYQYNASASGKAERCSNNGVQCLTTRIIL